MSAETNKLLTYVLANGDERTITLNPEILSNFVKWYNDASSNNTFDLFEEKSVQTTLFKDTILSVRY